MIAALAEKRTGNVKKWPCLPFFLGLLPSLDPSTTKLLLKMLAQAAKRTALDLCLTQATREF